MDRIDIHNYEVFMLDYLEGTISDQDKVRLLQFVDQHPELELDMETDVNLTLSVASEAYAFANKEQLKKHPSDVCGMNAKDYLLIKHHELGLNKEEEAELVSLEPNEEKRKHDLNAYAELNLKTEELEYPHKNKLRRYTLLPLFKQLTINRSIASICIITLLSLGWLLQGNKEDNPLVADDNLTKQAVRVDEVVGRKILEEGLSSQKKPSKDSLLKLAKDPMELNAISIEDKPGETKQYLASLGHVESLKVKRINAYEHGLNVMMPQYMTNNLLRQELVAIYRKIEDDQQAPTLSLALVERGVKVMNFLSKEGVKMEKYYNADGKVVAYQIKGENVELKRRAK